MKSIFLLGLLMAISSISQASASYVLSEVKFSSCDCASTQQHDSYKIKSGYCIFSLSGKTGGTILSGIIATANENIFTADKSCLGINNKVEIIYYDHNPIPEVVAIKP